MDKRHRIPTFGLLFVLAAFILSFPGQDSGTLIRQGDALYADGKAREALALFSQAIRIDSRSSEAYRKRGLCWNKLGEYDKAVQDFDVALALDPKNARAFNGRAVVRYHQKDYAGAILDCDAAIALDPKYASPYVNRSNARRALKDWAGAIADLDRALAIEPSNASAYYNRGLLRAEGGDDPGAIQDFTFALDRNPKYAEAFTMRGITRRRMEDCLGAIADCDSALQLNPGLWQAWLCRGQAKAALGDTEGARLDFEKTLALRPQAEAARQELAKLDAAGTPAAKPPKKPSSETAAGKGKPKDREPDTGAGTIWLDGPLLDRAEKAGFRLTDLIEDPSPSPAKTAPGTTSEPGSWIGADLRPDQGVPPVRTLTGAETARLVDPCPSSPAAFPSPLAGPPNLEGLKTELSRSLNSLTRTQYAGAVSAAMEASRLILAPQTPEDERRILSVWAPLFEFPSDAAIAYLERLNPLLVEFIALLQAAQAALTDLEQSQYEAEMAAAYESETGTREAMAQGSLAAATLRTLKARLEDVAARVRALGDPPDVAAEMCEARRRTKELIEPPPPSGPSKKKAAPPGSIFDWLDRTERGEIQVNVKFPATIPNYPHPAWAEGVGLQGSLTVDGLKFRFSSDDAGFEAKDCRDRKTRNRPSRKVEVEGTLFVDGKTIEVMTFKTSFRNCVMVPKPGARLPRLGDPPLTDEQRERIYDFVLKTTERTIVVKDIPFQRQEAIVRGADKGADFIFKVSGPQAVSHVSAFSDGALTGEPLADAFVEIHVSPIEGAAPAPPKPAPPSPDLILREKTAFHQDHIRLLEAEYETYRRMAVEAKDETGREYAQYMMICKASDIQRERDAVATLQSGNYVRTTTAWDAMVQAQMVAQSRQMASDFASKPTMAQRIERMINLMPPEERWDLRKWADAQTEGPGGFGVQAPRVVKQLAERVRDHHSGQAKKFIAEGHKAQEAIDQLEGIQTIAGLAMYATPFVAGGGTLALCYGVISGGIAGYDTGGLMGPEYRGTLAGTTVGAVTTALRFYSPRIDYGLTFYEGYVSEPQGEVSEKILSGMKNVAVTFVKRKIVETVTKAGLGYQQRLESARRQARLDAWRDARRSTEFQKEREYGKALVDRHSELYREYKSMRSSGADPKKIEAVGRQLMDATAAIKQAPHAKGYLKYNAGAEVQAAYNATDRLHTAQNVRQFKQALERDGFDTSGWSFRPIRNSGNTTPGMDLDLAIKTPQNFVTVRPSPTAGTNRMALDHANRRFQQVFDGVYARNSGGRTARASWQTITTDKHVESYQDLAWLKVGKVQHPLSRIDPKYAAQAARVTEAKAHEMRSKVGLSPDNRNWEIYRGTAKDIETKIIPLLKDRLSTNLTPRQRAEAGKKLEFYQKLGQAMELGNQDPVAADRAVRKLTGFDTIDIIHMTSMGIETLGKFR